MDNNLTIDQKDLIRKQLHEILDIVLDTNGLEERKQTLTGHLPTMFLEYSGHTNELDVRMAPDGWDQEASANTVMKMYLDKPIPDKDIQKLLDQCEQARKSKDYKPIYIEKKSRRVQLVVRPSVFEKIQAKAKQNGQSTNDFINNLFEKKVISGSEEQNG